MVGVESGQGELVEERDALKGCHLALCLHILMEAVPSLVPHAGVRSVAPFVLEEGKGAEDVDLRMGIELAQMPYAVVHAPALRAELFLVILVRFRVVGGRAHGEIHGVVVGGRPEHVDVVFGRGVPPDLPLYAVLVGVEFEPVVARHVHVGLALVEDEARPAVPAALHLHAKMGTPQVLHRFALREHRQ